MPIWLSLKLYASRQKHTFHTHKTSAKYLCLPIVFPCEWDGSGYETWLVWVWDQAGSGHETRLGLGMRLGWVWVWDLVGLGMTLNRRVEWRTSWSHWHSSRSWVSENRWRRRKLTQCKLPCYQSRASPLRPVLAWPHHRSCPDHHKWDPRGLCCRVEKKGRGPVWRGDSNLAVLFAGWNFA